MPGVVRNGRKRPSEQFSEDEDQLSSSSSVSVGSKRARYDRDALELPGSEEPTSRPRPQQRRRQIDHDEGDSQKPHQPGSIVRVKLRNFVTYRAAEFHPGPSLNMIIGPNGTGKSTLVCAICLGLGWETKNLGRAKEIGEFVKHGSTEATVEIELAAAPRQGPNPVIRRVIRKEGNKSAFNINDRAVTQKDVVRLAKSFSIQIDNLCQFLPQDRVVEFAGLTPVALLAETQRAAAPEQMVQRHEELKTLRSREKTLEVQHAHESQHLQKLHKLQNTTREDVQLWQQRQDLMRDEKALERCRPLIESSIIKIEHERVKEDRRAASKELARLKREIQPALEAQRDAEAYLNDVEKVRNIRLEVADNAKQRAERFARDIKTVQEKIKDYGNQARAERSSKKQRSQDINRLKNDIAKLNRSMEDPPGEVEDDNLRAKRAESRTKYSAAGRRIAETKEKMKPLASRTHQLREEYDAKVQERKRLDTQSGQQASRLQTFSRDTARGWEWFEQNHKKLQLYGEVHGPPILTCSVPDAELADAVESQLKAIDLTAITCTDGRDARLLSNRFLKEMKLHQIAIRTVPQALSSYRAPTTQDELKRYGFEGWMLDFVQGPDPVLAMLCDSAGFNRAAFSRSAISDSQLKAIERSPITMWTAGGQKYRIHRRREYGQSSTSVTNLKKASVFTNQPIDMENKQRLDNEIETLDQELRTLRSEHSDLMKVEQSFDAEQAEARAELAALKEEETRRRKARDTFNALPTKKNEKQRELDNLQETQRDTNNRVMQHKIDIENASLEAASLANQYATSVYVLRQAHENLVEAEIRYVEASSEVTAIRSENEHIQREANEKSNEHEALVVRVRTLREEYNTRVNMVKELLKELSEDENALFTEYQTQFTTIEELNNRIEAVKSKLEMMDDGKPHAVKAFEKREQEIAEVEERLQGLDQELAQAQNEVVRIRQLWEPELDRLVAKISDNFAHNFAQIGCAGQVGIHKDPDFENWAIEIQVRFREDEPLSVLDSQRQSGGERAVSTIFYLMALQDLARSPFRVVDEINQGMDPRNERMVHERMVDVACREHTSQYFLITPKLLTNLKFHPNMTVHCIASGEHMPEAGHEKLDFVKMAKMAIRQKRGLAVRA